MPMRLALSEVWPKEDSEAACASELPHTRLAAKLLRQRALGSGSAWQPYIAVRWQTPLGSCLLLSAVIGRETFTTQVVLCVAMQANEACLAGVA